MKKIIILLITLQIGVTITLLINDTLPLIFLEQSKPEYKSYYVQGKWESVVLKHNQFIRHSSDGISKSIIFSSQVSEGGMDNIESKLLNLENKIDDIYGKLTDPQIIKHNFIDAEPETLSIFKKLSEDYITFFNSIYYIDPIYGGADSYAGHGNHMRSLISNFPSSVKKGWPSYMKPHIKHFRRLLLIETVIVLFFLIYLMINSRSKKT